MLSFFFMRSMFDTHFILRKALKCAGSCFRGVLSGACMNPARAFGPAVVANHWNHHWIFWVGPACGALVTVGLIRYVTFKEQLYFRV